MTDAAELRSRRLFAQGLRGPVGGADGAGEVPAPGEADGSSHPSAVVDVVRDGLAVQSQEYLPAQWGLAQRIALDTRPDAAAVGSAIDRGKILRTHVLRPTWHFVAPDDARWLVELSAERVHRVNGTYYRRHGVEGADAARGLDAIAAAVADGRHATRADLATAVAAAGLPANGLGFTLLVMYAELERVIVSGANAGKQRTYAAFDERVPASAPRERADALAELAERYLRTRSPASPRDLSSWSGFGLGDVRAALADAGDRTGGRIEPFGDDDSGAGNADDLWHDAEVSSAWSSRSPEHAAADDDPDRVDLVQAYDEYIMGFAAPRSYLAPTDRANPIVAEFPLHAMFAGGVMIGRWAPVVEARRATIRIVPWRRMSRAQARSRDAAIAEVAKFLGGPATVEIERVARD